MIQTEEEWYVLSSHVTITPLGSDPKALYLIDKMSGRILDINPTIQYFLENLQTPHTYRELLTKIALDAGCLVEQIEPTTSQFLKSMRQIGIVNTLAEAVHYRKNTTVLFGTGDIIADKYEVVKGISTKRAVQLYLVKHRVTQEYAIIKCLYQPQALRRENTSKELQLFEQEIRQMQEIGTHPHICQLLEFVKDELVYGVIEYLEGETIREASINPAYAIADRMAWGEQILSAMAHLHSKGVLHGDLHTSNFMLSEDNTVKLINFGFAYHAELQSDELIAHSCIPHFTPPERVKQHSYEFYERQGSYSSEVFQLGIILYYLLTGKMPFEGKRWKELAHSILHDMPEEIHSTAEGEMIPEELKGIVLKALQKNPADRYASASEMYEAWVNAMTCQVGGKGQKTEM